MIIKQQFYRKPYCIMLKAFSEDEIFFNLQWIECRNSIVWEDAVVAVIFKTKQCDMNITCDSEKAL